MTPAKRQAAEFIARAKAIKAGREIPPDCRLPDTVDAIERGRIPRLRQAVLFDDSTMARLRAIKAGEVTT
jgi:hypothetical protein